MSPLARSFYERVTPVVAQELIGCFLHSAVEGEEVAGRIVETEAYLEGDPASHSFKGITARNASMFGPPGIAYIYRIYGIHWCMNAVTGPAGKGEAVLIRALEPVLGEDLMRRRRSLQDRRLLCSGPGRLCQALGITGALNGASLDVPPLWITRNHERVRNVVISARVGVAKGREQMLRFLDRDSQCVSRR